MCCVEERERVELLGFKYKRLSREREVLQRGLIVVSEITGDAAPMTATTTSRHFLLKRGISEEEMWAKERETTYFRGYAGKRGSGEGGGGGTK